MRHSSKQFSAALDARGNIFCTLEATVEKIGDQLMQIAFRPKPPNHFHTPTFKLRASRAAAIIWCISRITSSCGIPGEVSAMASSTPVRNHSSYPGSGSPTALRQAASASANKAPSPS